MSADPPNPFAAAGQPARNNAPAPSPFQTASPQVVGSVDNPFQIAKTTEAPVTSFPFAGVGSDSRFGLVDAAAGCLAKLPERRFPEPAQRGSHESSSVQPPFERGGAGHASLFEAVIGGPTEGFLAELPPNHQQPPPVQCYAPAAPVQSPVQEAPASVPGAFDPVEPQRVAQDFQPAALQQVAPVQPASSQEYSPLNGYNGNENGAALFDALAPGASSFAPVNSPPSSAHLTPAAPAQTARAEAPASRQGSMAHGGTPQLVLRAIFGVNHELTAYEMLQRSRTLPGVRNLHVIGSEEARAMRVLRDSVSRLGFGEEHSIGLSSPDGDIDIIEEEGTTLAILHEDGGYASGVRETLIIVTRELARLDS